ncbi:hypothetical protein GUJ93_ZPchr0001g30780 [Zizania palustris]|uniref:Hpc2-related domain-containing protein n=1 Tax=Zizania palustris TaxID=103762 RepID=A0A8J5V243_ZIZPA|nr:hypothetical protein GUJ93_ZPchr0001g30780 [Zizania palustris]
MEGPVAASSSAPDSSAAAAVARVAPAAPTAAVAPLPLAQQQVPAAAAAAAAQEAAAGCRRQVFSVELRPGETTIVSWKKLLKEADHAATSPPPAAPALAASEPLFLPSRVHLVRCSLRADGKHSSDEEDLDDVPDDDQYDTEDSFIDDAELDEYFEVDNLRTKHDGYLLTKGSWNRSGTSTNVAPKKRRRKDSSSDYIENNQVAPGDYPSIGNLPGKSTARSGAHVGKKLTSSNLGSYSEYYNEDNRVVKNKTGAPGGVPKRKSTNFAMGADAAAYTKIPSKDMPYVSSEPRDMEKHKVAVQLTDFNHRPKTSEAYDYPYSVYRDRDASMQLDFQQKRAYIGENRDPSNKMHRKEKHGMNEFSGMAATGAVYSAQPMTSREGSGTKPKGSRLERAIRDLQKIAAEYRPTAIDINEVDPNGQVAVKRRLPQEVKQKLAKVARLSANQGKTQEHELMDRLMGIVGHLVQRRTLKVNEHQDGSADDFQVVNDEKRSLKGKSVIDAALEDRICDLYDLYVEGMDEDKGPQSRKLYVELAELWPQGSMDNVGIKDAISRSKERRRLLYSQQKVRNEERMKRKRLAAAAKLQDSGYPAVMHSALTQQVAQPPVANPIATYPVTDHGQLQVSKSFERVRETSAGANPDDMNRNVGEMKKKKRKPESDPVDPQDNAVKAPSQHVSEKQKAPKRADEAAGTVLCLPFFDQPPPS